jgi:hypothetical protein
VPVKVKSLARDLFQKRWAGAAFPLAERARLNFIYA